MPVIDCNGNKGRMLLFRLFRSLTSPHPWAAAGGAGVSDPPETRSGRSGGGRARRPVGERWARGIRGRARFRPAGGLGGPRGACAAGRFRAEDSSLAETCRNDTKSVTTSRRVFGITQSWLGVGRTETSLSLSPDSYPLS